MIYNLDSQIISSTNNPQTSQNVLALEIHQSQIRAVVLKAAHPHTP